MIMLGNVWQWCYTEWLYRRKAASQDSNDQASVQLDGTIKSISDVNLRCGGLLEPMKLLSLLQISSTNEAHMSGSYAC